MLNTISAELSRPVQPFNIYYQSYICKLQDEMIEAEVSHSAAQISLFTELSQIKKLQKLLKEI